MPLPFSMRNLTITDDFIEWKSFFESDLNVCNRFSLDTWHRIVEDFKSDDEWRTFLKEYADYVQCYILYRYNDNVPIAFSFFLQEDEKGKVISIHGGGWKNRNTLLYYRGFIALIQALLNTKIKVRTTCLKDNKVAARFILSVGFVKYKETDNSLHFWINDRRLHNSRVYKRIFIG